MKCSRLSARVLPLLVLLLALPACDNTTSPEPSGNLSEPASARSPESIARAILADAEFNALVREITRNARTGNAQRDAATFVNGLTSERTAATMRRIFARYGVRGSNSAQIRLAFTALAQETRLSKILDCEGIYHATTAAITAEYYSDEWSCMSTNMADAILLSYECLDRAANKANAAYALAVEVFFDCMGWA